VIPVGYMAKRVSSRPEWLTAEVENIFSVSGCISSDFADYVSYWKHNGYWFFDSPAIIRQLSRDHSIDLSETRLFYYEVHELEFDGAPDRWSAFGPEPSFPTHVVPPATRVPDGYDVVTFSARASAECSPLSCNSLATEVETNRHCLLPSLEDAQRLLREGKFTAAEPGPYRIFAVYSTEWP
jgi:hypothetical protein